LANPSVDELVSDYDEQAVVTAAQRGDQVAHTNL
jgi:hypothetical protein